MPTTTRCLFVCSSVETDETNPDHATVTFDASTEASHPDHDFWRYTPYGTIVLHVEAPGAPSRFETGCTYYVDFTLAKDG